jgi:hypothetical protein
MVSFSDCILTASLILYRSSSDSRSFNHALWMFNVELNNQEGFQSPRLTPLIINPELPFDVLHVATFRDYITAIGVNSGEYTLFSFDISSSSAATSVDVWFTALCDDDLKVCCQIFIYLNYLLKQSYCQDLLQSSTGLYVINSTTLLILAGLRVSEVNLVGRNASCGWTWVVHDFFEEGDFSITAPLVGDGYHFFMLSPGRKMYTLKIPFGADTAEDPAIENLYAVNAIIKASHITLLSRCSIVGLGDYSSHVMASCPVRIPVGHKDWSYLARSALNHPSTHPSPVSVRLGPRANVQARTILMDEWMGRIVVPVVYTERPSVDRLSIELDGCQTHLFVIDLLENV